jgi:hypothetical protein
MKYVLIALICVVCYCNLFGQNYNNEVHILSNYYIKPKALVASDDTSNSIFSLNKNDILTIGFGYSAHIFKNFFCGFEIHKDLINKRFTTYFDTILIKKNRFK